MDAIALKKLKIKIFYLFPLAFLFIAGILMLFAGSLLYWQGWIFCAVIFISALSIGKYFLKRSPEFLERRFRYKEKEIQQKKIIKVSNMLFALGLLLSALDFRFRWSYVPVWLVIASDIIILVCYFLVFLAFKENSFAARTIEVFKGQKVIDTGPYALVRHPMYAGILPMILLIPLALGSFWALIPFFISVPVIIARTLNEEAVLKRDLPGYAEYCKKVRYRLIPFIW